MSGDLHGRRLGRALEWAGVALVLAYLAHFVLRSRVLQWDARSYYWAARAALDGLDPYRLESLSAMAGRSVSYPFVYPPIGLLPFLPLAALPLGAALAFWIGFKVVALALLIVVWHRLAPEVEWLPLVLVTVFGFGASALWDLRTGNVGIIEAALIWLGLAAFVRGRRWTFAAWIVAASCFKLAPAILLSLLLVPTSGQRSSPRVMLIAALMLFALVFVPLWVGPTAGWSGFLTNVTELLPVGSANPSLLGMFLAYTRGAWPSEGVAQGVAVVAWTVAVGLLVFVSAPWWVAMWRARDPRRWAFAAVWWYAIIAPRPMAYGFVLAASAPLVLAGDRLENRAGRLLIALVLSLQGLLWAGRVLPQGTLLQFTPVLLALALLLVMQRGTELAAGERSMQQVA